MELRVCSASTVENYGAINKEKWGSAGDPVASRKGILKQRYLWCRESKHHEQYAYQADYSKGKPRALAWQPISLKRPPLKEKDMQCGDVKDGDVDPVWGFAEYTIVGVEQHRDQHQAQQNFRQLDTPVVFLIFEEQPLNQCKEKQGPEQQLHMLPGRFVHPGKGRSQDASACPIVQKM